MLQTEIEQKAKEKVLSEIEKLPQFTHKFFTENETISFTTKRGYCGILQHFLNHVKDLYSIDDVLNISSEILGNLELNDINQYENILFNDFSESTVKSRLNSLKGIFKFLYYNQIISKNIMSQVIVDNKIESAKITYEDTLESLFTEVSHIENDFLRKRNLCIISIIVDTGLSVQDIVELNISNVVNNQIIFENSGNIIQYVLESSTIQYLNDYISIINTTNTNSPLFKSTMDNRISSSAVKNIFKQYGKNITPSNLQTKPHVTIKDTHNYTLIITRKSSRTIK